MATYQDFENSINNLLGLNITVQTLQLNSTAIEKAFEVYILSLTIEAVRRAGGIVTIVGVISGVNPNPVIFRAAPGSIYPTTQNFAYIKCSLNDYEFEVHVDVEFEGASGATHEIDISILEGNKAQKARDARRNPQNPAYIVECKFYSQSTPSTILARALVGLNSDFYSTIGSALVSNGGTDNLKTYLRRKSRPDPFLDLDPLISTTEERFIVSLEQKLRKWASV